MNKTIENILNKARKYTSPTFLVLLGFSFLLWLLINLGHTYVADVTVPVRIDGERIKVRCEAEGTGFRLVAHRVLRRSDIVVRMRDIDVSPSVINEDKLIINPSSLQAVISANTKDLRILAVGEIPEIPAPDNR